MQASVSTASLDSEGLTARPAVLEAPGHEVEDDDWEDDDDELAGTDEEELDFDDYDEEDEEEA